MERKKWWARLSGNLMDPNWRLCFPALLRGMKNLDSTSPGLESGCWSDIPCYPCIGQPRLSCPLLWPSAGLPSRIYFYREHPIHILPAKVYIKVELGCTYNGRWSKLYPSYSTPPHLLTVWETDSTGLKGAASPWHERGSHAMPLSAADFFSRADNEVVPSMKKNICMCQVWLFLLIGINRPTSLCYHTGELIPGKMFFSFSTM